MVRRTIRVVLPSLGLAALLACGPSQAPAPTAAPGAAKPVEPAQPAGPSAAASAAAAPASSPVATPAAAPPVAPAASPPSASGGPAASEPVRYALVPEQSEVAYRAREQFAGKDFESDAVGRTRAVSGAIVVVGPGQLRGRVERLVVELATLQSSSGNRDRFLRDNTLKTSEFPTAEFRSSDEAGPTSYVEGQEAEFKLPGVMMVRDREAPLVWDVKANLVGDTISGTATTAFTFEQFGLDKPRLAQILSIRDEIKLEALITARREASPGGAPSAPTRPAEPALAPPAPTGY